MDTIEELTLAEIKETNNEDLEKWYEEQIKMLQYNKIANSIIDKYYGISIIDLIEKIEEAEMKLTSEIFFPGEVIEMYPRIKELRAKAPVTCDFSAGIIKPGSMYVNYRPLFRNINNGRVFVLKRTIKVETGYWPELPKTLEELENFYIRATSKTNDDTGIDYNHFMNVNGETISFQELKRRNK